MKEIELYTTEDNKCPFIEWIKQLDKVYRLRIDKRIDRMRSGNFGDFKKLQNSELSELRFDFGKGYRIYFKELDDVIILILAGSDKKEQKSIIKLADSYYQDYIERKNK